MIIILCVAAVAVASLYVLLADPFPMRADLLFSIVGASLLLLWPVVCYLERKRRRQLQRLWEGLDSLR
jgi:hypothetical protein